MRSLQLQEALTEYLQAAGAVLQADLDAGAEIPFELEQQGRRRGSSGPGLFCYRPLTGEFIAQREAALERLPSHAEALRLLADFDGLDRYLVNLGVDFRGRPGLRAAHAGLAALLRELYAEQSDFQPRPERLDALLDGLQRSAMTATSELTLVATLHGLTITSREIALTSGLTIAHPDALEGLPAGALGSSPDDPSGHLVVVLALEHDDRRAATSRGEAVLKDLLRALRLFGDGRVSLGTLGWVRVAGGCWSATTLGAGGRPRGMLVVTPEQEDELRAFCNLVSRRAPDGNELAWALRRFELGCERDTPYEGLTDHLLALRALLEPEGPASGLLAGRLAALCATPERRLAMTERALAAIALERGVIEGAGVERAGAETLALEIADNLRALLRDVICGHLDADLVALADQLLLELEPEPELDAEPDERSSQGVVAALTELSGQQMFGDPSQAEEILDVFI